MFGEVENSFLCVYLMYYFIFVCFFFFLGPGQGVCGFRNAAEPGAPQVSQEGI